MKTVTLSDFLTPKQIQEAWELYEKCDTDGQWSKFASLCEKQIIEPNISVIQTRLGQQCDSRYLAFCVQHVFDQVSKPK